ncbi:lipid IV(A) 3-deoxy-D-manno-octulosonic acid transferase [Ectothiorhodospira sp. A-7R]|uniref:lipid IV(A) 3-deoxy-D-manno-octulosonic acid transferase n=1 Tax=Ectothiorhodospira lacustris TaxID=2899127 RepID=UPI001EE90EE2|nr:lipid IV(A) 3-deoxy-D-manno-octulosonic acid transferase [Ectothiorhodospira lacustris]MCG5500692.1 lipid IV(A) 3-deoxy-D-manno-octulosonic acid transferase [Ectothiorhodospira lacustris]MCG5521176.1 lipid IV(A) 3-deoxy-D-manno-octulosonic acid transferase [Ectothiorhodospira lacustris]
MRVLYSLILYVITPLVLARLLLRSRANPDYRHRWRERLGWSPHLPARPRLWVHAVSVGEVAAAAALVAGLRRRFPGHAILMTTTTPTGSAEVIRRFGNSVEHCYLPYDLPDGVARFLARARPERLLVMETELWPNLYRACARRGIPVMVVNARLSARSARGYARIRPLVRQTLAQVSGIAARGEEDACRFLALGARPDQVRVSGNIKYDLALSDDLIRAAAEWRAQVGERPVWIAASTHPGEDEPVLAAHRSLLSRWPGALLILVPRHPERFDAVAALCRAQGFAVARRSAGLPPEAGDTVWLGDTMGELMRLYGVASVAFVGGSLVPTGGHNPLEPAAHGVAVVTGPQVFNFTEVYEALDRAGGVRRVADADGLAAAVSTLWSDLEAHRAITVAARRVLDENRGAVDRVLDWVDQAS